MRLFTYRLAVLTLGGRHNSHRHQESVTISVASASAASAAAASAAKACSLVEPTVCPGFWWRLAGRLADCSRSHNTVTLQPIQPVPLTKSLSCPVDATGIRLILVPLYYNRLESWGKDIDILILTTIKFM